MKKLKLAIIGQGRSGRNIHGKFYKSEDNDIFDVVAVVEKDPARRELALQEYPGCVVYEDYTELFARTDIDLVVNDTYSEMHFPITRDLLMHKFNVLSEKPFGENYRQCTELIQIAKDNGVMVTAFQQTFLAPFYLEAKKIAKSGILGDILQVNLRYNGLARRWDWQTLLYRLAGCVYNTGPHPIGLALDFLDFDDNARVEYSKLAMALSSGDGEDYAKIIMSAPNKPVVDVEISSVDPFTDYTLKIQGTKGTFKCTPAEYKMQYIVDGENPERPVVEGSLKNDAGMPAYCGEKLVKHEEEGTFNGTAFDVAVSSFYHMLYNTLTTGAPLDITAEMAAKVTNVIETVHAQNPLPVKYYAGRNG